MVRLARPDGRPSLLLFILLGAIAFFQLQLYRQGASNARILKVMLATSRRALKEPSSGTAGAALELASVGGGGGKQRALKPIPRLESRRDLPRVLEEEGLKTGAELGVLFGEFAEHTLSTWASCEKYYLVDLWGVLENYIDLSDSDAETQEQRFQQTKDTLAPWKDKTVFLRMLTTEAAKKIPDNSLDYVYVDARHDYCGVMEDLVAYWPKLKSGGILAGHDFLYSTAQQLADTGQNWSVCSNGTVNEGAVRGAVEEFAAEHGLELTVTYQDGDWPTWISRKP